MDLYSLALFAHIVAAIGVFAGVSAWLYSSLIYARATRVEEVRPVASLSAGAGSVTIISLPVLAAAGLYMALTVWGVWSGWLIVATVAFLLLAPVGALVIDPRMRAITRLANQAPDGPLPENLRRRARDPLLYTGLETYISYLFGVVFIMTNKPDVVTSIWAMLVALLVGLGVSALTWGLMARRQKALARPA